MSAERNDESAAKAAEEDEAAAHIADRPPTDDEEEAAERSSKDPAMSGDHENVAGHYRDMTERGVNEQGEGRIP